MIGNIYTLQIKEALRYLQPFRLKNIYQYFELKIKNRLNTQIQ